MYLLRVLVFLIVLFLYIHLHHQWKTSNELEVYELDSPLSKDMLEDALQLKQPVIFTHPEEVGKMQIQIQTLGLDVSVRQSGTSLDDQDVSLYSLLPLQSAQALFDKDKSGAFFTEHNQSFLEESGLGKRLRSMDAFFRPAFCYDGYYDLLMGSQNATSPLRYDLQCRNYFIVSRGSLQMKLAPPNMSKYMECIHDYENFEFRSTLNPWMKEEDEKVRCIHVNLNEGDCICIPPFWWYSLKFEGKGQVVSMKYRTYMNGLSMLPQIGLFYLQNYNIRRRPFVLKEGKEAKEETERPERPERPEIPERQEVQTESQEDMAQKIVLET